jgi:hypothetical protein
MAEAILRQLSPDCIRPGDRADHFSDRAALELYAAGVNEAVDRARDASR